MRLPIDEILPELIRSLRDFPAAILRAPTGAGKTTRVPPSLLDAGLAGEGSVLMLEPRRIAARAAARRIAEERGATLGEEVGYQVRFERKAGNRTRILVVTEGVLLGMLQKDPFLDGVGALLFDEFHERRLESDLALAMARRLQREARPDLRLVAMSATAETGPIAAFLGDCPVHESEGFLHPVEKLHLATPLLRDAPEATADAVLDALRRTEGDVLAFFPGVGEIRRARRRLEERRLGVA
ncbi:MAG: DEAD/DEAH box helicase, partial [Planctomycetes bacterium]|nr:DEAD/DEAH box helicase [Planctomycetota bacterium]